MQFKIGNLCIDFSGECTTAEKVRDIFHPLRGDGSESDSDLVFQFVDRLSGWKSEAFTKLDNYEIGVDRFRVLGRFWSYDVQLDGDRMIVRVAERKKGLFRRLTFSVRKSWKYFHTHGRGVWLQKTKRFIYYIFLPMLEFALLRKQLTLAHSSVIVKDSKALLLPSWGGVGKTSLMSRFIEQGWTFLSDDLCVISREGHVYLFPLPLHVYCFHETHCPQLVARMLRNAPWWDRILWSLGKRAKQPGKLVRWVHPGRVFGKHLAARAKIAGVIHMQRCRHSDTFEHKDVKPEDIAPLMANTILNEISTLTDTAIVTHSCSPSAGIHDVAQMHGEIERTYISAFSEAACFLLRIPEKGTPEETFAYINHHHLGLA